MASPSILAYAIIPGLAIGLATGLSKTEGTTKTAITGLVGLIGGGGVMFGGTVSQAAVQLSGVLAGGFIIGIIVGVILRIRVGWTLHWF